MPFRTQYMYPSGELGYPWAGANFGFYNEVGSQTHLYSSVNQGVSTPNDSTYVYTDMPSWSGVVSLFFMLDHMSVIPDALKYLQLNIRYKNDEQHSVYTLDQTYIDKHVNSGDSALAGDYTVYTAPVVLPYTSGQWVNLSLPMNHYNNVYGIDEASGTGDLPFGTYDTTVSIMYFKNAGAVPTQNLYISEIEYVCSGVYKYQPQKGASLYVNGVAPYNSGMTLYEGGKITPTSGTTLVCVGPSGSTKGMTLFECVANPTFSGMTLYEFSQNAPNTQILPVNYFHSKVHSSGTFTPSGLFKDTFFDFTTSGNRQNLFNPYYSTVLPTQIWNSEVGSGSFYVYTPPSPTESGWSQIFAPGQEQTYEFTGYHQDNNIYITDGTTAHFSSNDKAQTSNILPPSGNYSLYVSQYDRGTWSNITNYDNLGMPSGSYINFDGCRLVWNADYTVNFQTNSVNVNLGPAYPEYVSFNNPGNDTFNWQDYIVSYSGAYTVWGGYMGLWRKLYSGPAVQRSSISNPGIYTGNPSGDTAVIYNLLPYPQGTGLPLVTQAGINKIGVVASGISDADVGIFTLSQSSLTEILGTLDAHPSGFVRYDAFQGNQNNNAYAPPYLGNPAQSYLPYGRVPSGATNINYVDNFGTYKLLPASGIPTVGGLYFYTGNNEAPSGLYKVYDFPAHGITYSGWINSQFSGDFVIALTKDISVYNPTFTSFAGGYTYTYASNIRYRCAYDTFTVFSGNNLYYKPLRYMVEGNFDEIYSTTTFLPGGGTNSSDTVTQRDGGISWDLAYLKVTATSGNQYQSNPTIEFKADINNAVLFASYIGGPVPATGTGMPLFIGGMMTASSGCDLFLEVATPTTNMERLFVQGKDVGQSGTTLCVTGIIPVVSGRTLYTQGANQLNGHCDMFVKSYDPVFSTRGMTLNVWTSGSPPFTTPYSSGCTLWLEQAIISSGSIPLYINSLIPGSGFISQPAIPLFTWSQQPSGWNSLTFAMSGPNGTASGCDLSITGATPTNKSGIPLFTRNDYKDVISWQFPLSIKNVTYVSGYLNTVPLVTISNFNQNLFPLFAKTIDPTLIATSGYDVTINDPFGNPITQHVPVSPSLYISTLSVTPNSGKGVTLYTQSIPQYGTGVPLFMDCTSLGGRSGLASLYTAGLFGKYGQSGLLYVSAPNPKASGVRISIEGATSKFNRSTTLFTRNDYKDLWAAATTLTISNRLIQSGGTSLYTIAGFNQNLTTMFLKGQVPSYSNNYMPFLITSRGVSTGYLQNGSDFSEQGFSFGPFSDSSQGPFITVTQPTSYLAEVGLFIRSKGIGNGPTMFIAAPPKDSFVSATTLYINNNNPSVANSVGLYVEAVHAALNSVNFYTTGAGMNPGSFVNSNATTLYIARPNNIWATPTQLYMSGPSGNNTMVPMFISGGTLSSKSMTFTLASTKGGSSGNTQLYTHGF